MITQFTVRPKRTVWSNTVFGKSLPTFQPKGIGHDNVDPQTQLPLDKKELKTRKKQQRIYNTKYSKFFDKVFDTANPELHDGSVTLQQNGSITISCNDSIEYIKNWIANNKLILVKNIFSDRTTTKDGKQVSVIENILEVDT